MLIRNLSKAFQTGLTAQPFFERWRREKAREYWKREDDLNLGIDLQLGKAWEKEGGTVAINLWCGHRWTVPAMGWIEDGIDYCNTRLSPKENHDHWWDIATAAHVEQFGRDFEVLLDDRAIPWFDKVSTKEGFLEWYSTVFPPPSNFPYILELHGESTLKNSVCEWLASAPRHIEPQLDWLVETDIISAGLSSRLRMASLQASGSYQSRLPELVRGIEQGDD